MTSPIAARWFPVEHSRCGHWISEPNAWAIRTFGRSRDHRDRLARRPGSIPTSTPPSRPVRINLPTAVFA